MRSPYADPNDDEEDPFAPYAPSSLPEGFDEGGAADADATAYAGDPSYQTTGNADWLTQAPEAAGAAPFSTTPENRAPRSDAHIGKPDLPKIGQSDSEKSQAAGGALARDPRYDELDRLDKKIEKENNPGFFGSLARTALALQSPGAYGLLVGGKGRDLQRQRDNLTRDLAHDENQRGATARYLADQRAASSKYAAEQRLAGSQARSNAMEKGDIEEGTGFKYYADPVTGALRRAEVPSQPAKGNVLDADDPSAQSKYSFAQPAYAPRFAQKGDEFTHFAEDPNGNITGISKSGKVKRLGKYGKGREPREQKEDPGDVEDRRIEANARAAGRAARAAYLRDPINKFGKDGKEISPEEVRAGAQAASREAYEDAGGKVAESLPKAFAHPRGAKKNLRNDKTGELEPFVSDGKKWVPARG